MDPDRLRSYMQMACSGLGFDIGEVWWTSRNGRPSSPESVESEIGSDCSTKSGGLKHAKHVRFVELYTSKSYSDQKSKLVAPSKKLTDRLFKKSGGRQAFLYDDEDEDDPILNDEEARDVEKHKLSPKLVDAISYSSQVVWANCQKTEGLLGRSDMRLQTAVGMPIAMDGRGHMCVVVMFSPNNISSNDDAMDYLQFLRRTALSTSIPCLLPALPQGEGGLVKSSYIPINIPSSTVVRSEDFGDGVIARFVSFNDKSCDKAKEERDVRDAPTDCFGIPMLPSYAEVGFNSDLQRSNSPLSQSSSEAFDEASYGIWSTVMQTRIEAPNHVRQSNHLDNSGHKVLDTSAHTVTTNGSVIQADSRCSSTNELSILDQSFKDVTPKLSPTISSDQRMIAPLMSSVKQSRLEEFASGFLGMSVFDISDIWMPDNSDRFTKLRHIATVTSSVVRSETMENFIAISQKSSISVWSGSVGRAFGSGNPVWSSKQGTICDEERFYAFQDANVKTALSVPVYSPRSVLPVFVLSFYSFVKADAVPVVLRFLQQAIRLVWDGLEHVVPEPATGLESEIWQGLEPSDLGEMAADLELQNTFVSKRKRVPSYSNLSNMTKVSQDDLSQMCCEDESTCEGSTDQVLNSSMMALNVINSQQPSISYVSGVSSQPAAKKSMLYQDAITSQSVPRQAINSNQDSHYIQVRNEPSHSQQSQPTQYQYYQPSVATPAAIIQRQSLEDGLGFQTSSSNTHMNVQNGNSFAHPNNYSQQTDTSFVPTQVNNCAPFNGNSHLNHTRYIVHQNTQHEPPTSSITTQVFVEHDQSDVTSQHPQIYRANNFQPVIYSIGAPNSGFSEQQQSITYLSQPEPDFNVGPTNQGTTNVPYNMSEAQANIACFNQIFKSARNTPSDTTSKPIKHEIQPSIQPRLSIALNQDAHRLITPSPLAAPLPLPQVRVLQGVSLLATNSCSNVMQPTMFVIQPGSGIDEGVALVNNHVLVVGTNPSENANDAMSPLSAASNRSEVMQTNNAQIPKLPLEVNESFSKNAANGLYNGQETKHDNYFVCQETSGSSQICPSAQGFSNEPQHDTDSSHNSRICRIIGCNDQAVPRRPYCQRHSGNRQCEHPDCNKCAQGSTRFCIAHGGGRRCTFPGCDKGARDKFYCAAHGGGKRCSLDGCNKSAVGGSTLCTAHGGGRRCAVDGCTKSAQSSTSYCVKHGGGKKCGAKGCDKVARGRTLYCAAHGGGVRCKLNGCTRVAVGKMQLCRAHGGGARSKNKGNSPSPEPEFNNDELECGMAVFYAASLAA